MYLDKFHVDTSNAPRRRARAALPACVALLLLCYSSGEAAQPSPPTGSAPPATIIESVAGRRPTAARALELGRQYTQEFTSGNVAPLWDKFSPQMKRTMGREGLRSFHLRVRMQAGKPLRVIDERVIGWLGSDIYQRTAQFSIAPDPVDLKWTFDADGRILGFTVTPHHEPAASADISYRTHAHLALPFTGTWFVYWGGPTLLENYHAANAVQRFAYDFVVARAGKTAAGSRHQNANFFCYGKEILAPAPGTVVRTVNDVAENRPGQLNEAQPFGNFVMLDLGAGEFAVLAHLQPGSVAVQPGEKVSPGQLLGRCGNSGRSSEPHLHFHLQSEPQIGAGHGLPAQFESYLADGDSVARGEPTRGMVLQSVSAK